MTEARQGRSRATARDVADLVPCSVATVSLVVNGKSAGRVRPAIEQQVWQAVRRLDYQVNRSASALARKTPSTVALVFPDPTDPFFSCVLDGVMSALGDEHTLNLVAPRKGDDYGPLTIRRALACDLAGLVVASPGPAILEDLAASCPVIVLEADGQYSDVTTINPDIESAARELAEHLVGLGHRRLAFAGSQRSTKTLHRREALRGALKQRGADLVLPDILIDRLSIDEARKAFTAQWGALDRSAVTALVCSDDVVAYGALASADVAGVDVPGRLSVAGMNNLPYSEVVSPRLTSVDLCARELGIRAVVALRAYADGNSRPVSETVPSKLMVRRSTAAPA